MKQWLATGVAAKRTTPCSRRAECIDANGMTTYMDKGRHVQTLRRRRIVDTMLRQSPAEVLICCCSCTAGRTHLRSRALFGTRRERARPGTRAACHRRDVLEPRPGSAAVFGGRTCSFVLANHRIFMMVSSRADRGTLLRAARSNRSALTYIATATAAGVSYWRHGRISVMRECRQFANDAGSAGIQTVSVL